MFQKILVPLDGSTNAEITIPYVLLIGASLSTEIILVSVADPRIGEIDQLHQSYLDHKTKQLQVLLHDSEKGKNCRITNEVLRGKASDEIIHYANNHNVDLIAVASQGSSGQKPPLLGNVSEKILRGTRKPVLLIRTPAKGEATGNELLRKILLPLDGSVTGEAALKYVVQLSQAFGSELTLFQAIEPIKHIAGYETLTTLPLPKREDIKTAVVDYLKTIQNRLKDEKLDIAINVTWGSAAESIVDYAENNKMDLIALSAHGQSNISRWVFGSVTDKVLHAGETPLLIIPQP